MNTYLNNSLPIGCSYCNQSYQNEEIKNTDKVVELTCRHLFHKQCIASKFQGDEDNGKDLTCPGCSQISIAKKVSRNLSNISAEDIKAHLSATKEDPYYKLQPEFLDAIDELENRVDSVKILLDTITSHIYRLFEPDISQEEKDIENAAIEKAFKDWISANILPHSQCIAGKIIADFFAQDRALRTLDKETEYLSSIEPSSRFQLIPEEGVPVLDYSNNRLFKMRVSKDYMLRTVQDYQSKQNI